MARERPRAKIPVEPRMLGSRPAGSACGQRASDRTAPPSRHANSTVQAIAPSSPKGQGRRVTRVLTPPIARVHESAMSLSSDEIERYARHLVLRDVGGPGQGKLKAARVLVIGAGGLGAPLIQYLAAAGVGTIGIVDDDTVSLSNLQRQVIHGTPDIGRPKTESAAAAVARLNPEVRVERHAQCLTPENARDLVRAYDLIGEG